MIRWRPIETFFQSELEGPDVWLAAENGRPELSYYDEDEKCWRATANDMEFKPTGWLPIAEFERRSATS